MEDILKTHLRKYVVDKTVAEGIIAHVEGVEEERDNAEEKFGNQAESYKTAAETNQKKADTLRIELDEVRRKVIDNTKAAEQVTVLSRDLNEAQAEIARLKNT